MQIGVVVPTRGNRPELLQRCEFYLSRQTLQPDKILFVNYPPVRQPYDLTDRYKQGLTDLKGKVDYIFCIEDDDWYSEFYIEKMKNMIISQPDFPLYGLGVTWYYHIQSGGMMCQKHDGRAAAFCTVVKSDIVNKIDWDKMHPLWFDISIWKQFTGLAPVIDKPIAIGIKHGVGPCGGAGHTKWLYEHHKNAEFDSNYEWLKQQICRSDFDWYMKFINVSRKTNS